MESNGNRVLSDFDRTAMIECLTGTFENMLELMGISKDDPQTKETPGRMAKMYVNELCSGLYDEEPKITVFPNTKEYDEMVLLGPVQIKSICSHHFIPFIGNAYIAYIPDKKVIGISKLARICKWFMRRPQIQEELTKQIADYLQEKLSPKGVAVFIEAQHLCMTARGVEEHASQMKTSDLRGAFIEKPEARQEFFNMITN